MTKRELEHLTDLLAGEDVRRALAAATAVPAPLADIELPPIDGLTRAESRALISALMHASAIRSPFTSENDTEHWYVLTNRIIAACSELDRFCSKESQLYVTTATRQKTRFLVQCNVEETIAAAQLSGIQADYDAIRETIFMQRQPRNDVERLVVNHLRLSEQLPSMAHREWTPDLLLELHTHLTHGVRTGSSSPRPAGWPKAVALRDQLCRYAEETAAGGLQHSAITALIVRATVNYWELFPSYSGMMSRLLFRLYATKTGYPVGGYIPVSRSERDYLRQAGKPLVIGLAGLEDSRTIPANLTPWLDVQLTLLTHALSQFRSDMARADAIDDAVRVELESEPQLNHRQRSILGRALREPDATFRIAYHQTAHGIGYATAYRDLTELVDRGYLTQSSHGRMKVFRAGPGLEARAGALHLVGRPEDYEVPLPAELLAGH